MGKKYLIDTSVVIKYVNNSLVSKGLYFVDEIVDKESQLSFVTEIELQAWQPEDPHDIKVYEDFIVNSFIHYVDNIIIRETINIRKNYRLKIPDALIAATAICNNLTLIGDNDKDFLKIPNLKYINPNRLV